jgi:hypothetical protein
MGILRGNLRFNDRAANQNAGIVFSQLKLPDPIFDKTERVKGKRERDTYIHFPFPFYPFHLPFPFWLGRL